jgi:hypothetical protein
MVLFAKALSGYSSANNGTGKLQTTTPRIEGCMSQIKPILLPFSLNGSTSN